MHFGLFAGLCGACSSEAPPSAEADDEANDVFFARAPVEPPLAPDPEAADLGPNPWLTGFPEAGLPGAGGGDTDLGAPHGAGGAPPNQTGSPDGPPAPLAPAQLLMTQYYEGLGNNKALELTNLGAQALELSRCRLTTYVNGGTAPYRNAALSGTLAAGESLVLCSSGTTEPLSSQCDGTSTAIAYNGNDAVLLSCDEALLDSFGRLGEDPGVAWGTAVRSIDSNLIRLCGAVSLPAAGDAATGVAGDTVPDDPFDPAAQWRSVPLDDLDDLGIWSCPDGSEAPPGNPDDPRPDDPPPDDLPEGFEPLDPQPLFICDEEELLLLPD